MVIFYLYKEPMYSLFEMGKIREDWFHKYFVYGVFLLLCDLAIGTKAGIFY